MEVTITTPDKTLFQGSAKLLQLPGTSGSFELLESHAPLVATLTKGKIRLVEPDENTSYFEIKAGVVEVLENEIQLLVQ